MFFYFACFSHKTVDSTLSRTHKLSHRSNAWGTELQKPFLVVALGLDDGKKSKWSGLFLYTVETCLASTEASEFALWPGQLCRGTPMQLYWDGKHGLFTQSFPFFPIHSHQLAKQKGLWGSHLSSGLTSTLVKRRRLVCGPAHVC